MDSLLIIDDEKSLLDVLSLMFKKEGYEVKTAASGAEALDILTNNTIDLVITDIRMPHLSGMEILKYVKENQPETPVIVITAYGSIQQAVEALKAGALDYIVKPFDIEELKILVARGLERKHLELENILLKKDLKDKYKFENMIGKSRLMQEVYVLIDKVAGTDSTVLITGESGTGKEVFAHAIHNMSPRRKGPFVKVNCAAVPETLLESELFGYAEGAFTGARKEGKPGKFELANHGTIFLDEIGDMSFAMQAKLLRVLQEKEVERVGAVHTTKVDVRVIAATNQDLDRLVAERKFREDLYYRLNVIKIKLPSLRERREDIPLLFNYFLNQISQKMQIEVPQAEPTVLQYLINYDWPGNVRELQNVVERMINICNGSKIRLEHLPQEILQQSTAVAGSYGPASYRGTSVNMQRQHRKQMQSQFEQEEIMRLLCKYGGNITRVAQEMGIARNTVYRKMKKYNIDI